MSVTSGPAASQPFTQRRELWILMGYAVPLGVFGAFAGLVFIGVIKAGASGTPIPIPAGQHPRCAARRERYWHGNLANDPRAVAGPAWRAVGRSAQWFVRNPRRGRPAAHGHPEPADLRAGDGAFDRPGRISYSAIRREELLSAVTRCSARCACLTSDMRRSGARGPQSPGATQAP
jgi:hypothetical protein